MQKTFKQTKVYRFVLLLCLKSNDPQTFKSGICKNPFSLVCMLLVQPASMNIFILCDNWNILLSKKIYRYSDDILSAMLLLVLKPVF